MVAESFAPGASVSKVAQRYGVNANLLFTWRRRDARSTASGGTEPIELLRVRVEGERALAVPVAAPGPVGRMEIVLSRSSSAVVILASPNTPAHSPKLRLVVMMTLVRS